MTPQRGKPHPPTKHEASAEVKAWKPLPEWPRSGQMPRTRKAVPNTESELFLHTPPAPATPQDHPCAHSPAPHAAACWVQTGRVGIRLCNSSLAY